MYDARRAPRARGRLGLRHLSLLALSACVVDGGVHPVEVAPIAEGDTGPGDSPAPLTCPSESFPATPVTPRDVCALGAIDWTPNIEWTNTDPGRAASAPLVAQLTDDDGDGDVDDDDLPDVVVVGADLGDVWAIAGDGTTLWDRARLGHTTTPAIGDLDGDGLPEVVVCGYWETVALRGADGSTFWTGPAIPEGFVGGPAIADMEADGEPEVVVGSTILDGRTGALRGRGAEGVGVGWYMADYAAIGVVADLDLDGLQEAVVGNAAYDANGDTIWANGDTDGFVAVGDFDDDPEAEIVVSYDGEVRLQEHDGTVVWRGVSVGLASGAPAIGDVDGDGEPEIGLFGWTGYYVLEADGSILWWAPVTDPTGGYAGSALFDFDGDGALEVVVADGEDVLVLDGRTGAVLLRETDHASLTYNEYATVADVDGDGHAEILYTSSGEAGPVGLRVLGDAANTWPPARTIWNQTAYAAAQVNDDGTLPATPVTSWEGSTFRANRLATTPAPDPAARADLYPHVYDTCTTACEDGRLTVWISVGNQGHADVTGPVTVQIWGDPGSGRALLESIEWTAPLPAGTLSEAREIELAMPGRLYSFDIDVDGGAVPGTVDECDEANNVLTWRDGLCP